MLFSYRGIKGTSAADIAHIDSAFKWLFSKLSPLLGGVSGTFTTADSKTVTVTNGIITKIQ